MNKTLSFTLLLLTACGGGLASMPTGPKPTWIDGAAAEFAADSYFTAVGMTTVKGEDLEATQKAADLAARSELTKKLEVSVSSEFSSFQAETNKNGQTSSVEVVQDLTREAVKDFDLTGTEIKARWLDRDSKVAYALVVWPKARAEAQLKAKLSELESTARQAEGEGDKNVTGNPAVALKQFLAARAALETAQNQAILLRVVTGKSATVPDISGVRGKLDKLLAGIDVKVTAGDGQRVKAGEAAPQPFVVQATVAGTPIVGLPVLFELPTGTIDAVVTTDAQGTASARVANVGPLASGEAKATAKVAWGRFAGLGDVEPGWAKGLRNIELSFRVVARALNTTRVLVKIVDSIQDAPGVATNEVQSAISNGFSSAGFNVVDAEALVARIPIDKLLTLDPKEFQKQARDLGDIVVIGQAATSFSSTLSGDVMVHRARLTLRVVDLGTGQVLATTSEEKKGDPGKGSAKAGQKALAALAKGLDPSTPGKVRAALGL